MADTVRGIMEAMVPELEDYVARGYFSNGEVSSIIRNRQKFEYSLRRRNADKQDFLRYCEYEWKLEQLRQLRRKAREISGKRSLADYGIVRRVHFIYDRATRKFKGDVSIWMSWLQFCRESSSKRQVSKVVTKALKLHPSAPYFWAYAAAWEFEGNSNPAAARQLLQSGLRHCPSDGSLWVEYFRMELLYANKLKARRQVLGLDDEEPDSGSQTAATTADAAILQGKLASVVHKTAVAKLPSVAEMRLDMLRATRDVAITCADDLQQAIISSYVEDLGNDSGACCGLATVIEQGHAPQLGTGLRAACEFLQERIQATEDAQMQYDALGWASDRIVAMDEQCAQRSCAGSGAEQSVWAVGHGDASEGEPERGQGGAAEEVQEHCEYLCEWIVLCADMSVSGGCRDGVIGKKVQALLRSGQVSQGYDVLKGGLQLRPRSVALWQMALRMSVASAGVKASPEGADMCGYGNMIELVSAALKSTEGCPNCEGLIPQSVASLAAMQEPLDAALSHMLKSLAVARIGSDGDHVAQVLEATWTLKGKAAGVALAERVAAMPSPGAQFWRTYAQLCVQCAASNGTTRIARKESMIINRVFEQAVAGHGKDAEIWLQWIRFLESNGADEAVLVTQRALATLPAKAADTLSLQLRAA